MDLKPPSWTLTGENDTIDVTVRRLTGARARNTVPDILEVLTAFASTDEGAEFITTLVGLQGSGEDENKSTFVEELPRIIHQFSKIVSPVLAYFEANALTVLTTATQEQLETYGTFPEICLMIYQSLVWHYQTSMTPQVSEALKKFGSALVLPAAEAEELAAAA